jgi:hypothetical protein
MSSPAGMLGPMFALKDGFDAEPLTQSDLVDYEQRIGNKSPTMMDAMRFSILEMRVQKSLSHKDHSLYRQTILALKGTPRQLTEEEKQKGQEVLRTLRNKALSSDPEKVQVKRERKEDIYGMRVRLISDPSRRGLVPERRENEWRYGNGAEGVLFNVHFDGEAAPEKDNIAKMFRRIDLQLLCARCDKDGKFCCSRCQRERYCSSECQKVSWQVHKLSCRKPKAQA